MVGKKIQFKFKQRSPISQLLLSLFIPFYYLYWLASSHKQINQLAGKDEKGTPSIRMSVWWPISLMIAGAVLLVGAIVVVVTADVDTDRYSASSLPVASASVVAQAEGDLLPTDPPDLYQTEAAGEDELLEWNASPSITATAEFFGLYLLGLLAFIAFQFVHFFYLLQHTDGLVRLAGSDQDKTYLIVTSAIGCFVFQGLLLAVVHKSQSVINQAIAGRDQSST